MAAQTQSHGLSDVFCMNTECPAFQQVGADNIRLKGHTGKSRKVWLT